MAVTEFTIIASKPAEGIDIGPPGAALMANAEVYNGTIPGPILEGDVDDTFIVRLINNLPYPTGIHWHGIELPNNADGTPVTQRGTPGAPLQTLGNGVPAGGTYLYKFKVTRPGIFWYHPHHFHSTNRVFRGLYGMIIVNEPAIEGPLVGGVLPLAAQTHKVVLSDMTVCGAPAGGNPGTSYSTVPGDAEWLSLLTNQSGPTPLTLCETEAMAEDGSLLGANYAMGDIPNIQRSGPGQTVEGNVVLANGRDPGARNGTPGMPGALSGTNVVHPVVPGQGLRLQLVNCAHLRYFRLRLTDAAGAMIQLKRIGGEGGLLNQPVLEGDPVSPGLMKYDEGEILLPPATRADLVAEIPTTATGTLTLWTRDYRRTGPGPGNPNNWAQLPTVPVMHFQVGGAALPQYNLALGTNLRGANPVPVLNGAAVGVLNPATFTSPMPKPGMNNSTIGMNGGNIDGTPGDFSGAAATYVQVPHLMSDRYVPANAEVELQVQNNSAAHHPFHLHGFSFQPKSLDVGGQPVSLPTEFRDTQDIPPGGLLTFRIDTSDRALNDEVTMGGAFGRWLFHCHIFFHAHSGMISEMVVPNADGTERPHVNVGGSWTYTPVGGTATRSGTFEHRDSKVVSLTASEGNLVFTPGAPSGTWNWEFDATGAAPDERYVYITADDGTLKDQAVFRLKIGAPDDGSDIGDPHLRSVDGSRFDFQAVGEFVLLKDDDGTEVQTRQTPVAAATPIAHPHSELKVCVSLNTAFAARVGPHRVSYQPMRTPEELVFFLDGKPTRLPKEGLDLGAHHLSVFDANGRAGIRLSYANGTIVTVTPKFWTKHKFHYLDVEVARTQADQGLIAPFAPDSWLPRLSTGRNLGPRPKSLSERFDQLYRQFADSWRVTDASSLFVYEPSRSTGFYTDRNWPAEKPPCKIKPELEIPNAPILPGMTEDEARKVCKGVQDPTLFEACVLDVAATGDPDFAKHYAQQERQRDRATAVHIAWARPQMHYLGYAPVKAHVAALACGKKVPRGDVEFLVDNKPAGKPVPLNEHGQAFAEFNGLRPGQRIRARYLGTGGKSELSPSSSANLIVPTRQVTGHEEHHAAM